MGERVLVCGTPGCGKSSVRRKIVRDLRSIGMTVNHWDADNFPQSRTPEDADMREPDDGDDMFARGLWVVEDVRGTLPHTADGRGAWRNLEYYDHIIYVQTTPADFALFWTSRALQWRRLGGGDHKRDQAATQFGSDSDVLKTVRRYLTRREDMVREDTEALQAFVKTNPRSCDVTQMWTTYDEVCENIVISGLEPFWQWVQQINDFAANAQAPF